MNKLFFLVRACLLGVFLLGLVPGAAVAQQIGTFGNSSYNIRPDGTLWAWGYNGDGELGDGSNTQRLAPVQVGTVATWQSVAAGQFHAAALRTDGSLWAWGYNGSGQLGDGTTTQRPAPVAISAGTTWLSVAAGQSHTLGIRTDGSLWAWGSNSNGQLGNGTTGSGSTPVAISAGTTWLSVAAGSAHTVAIRADGSLWAWGFNGNGRLGDGTTTQRTAPVPINAGTTWLSVAAGGAHTVAIRADGSLWAWGNNGNGRLGDGTTTQRTAPVQVGTATTWKAVAAGPTHTLAVRADGTLWAWGANDFGQLGDGTTSQQASPVQVGTLTTWKSVKAGNQYTLALRTDNSVWAWGYNLNGQLGSPNAPTPIHNTPAQVGTDTDWAFAATGGSHTVAAKTTGTLWALGNNTNGQLGQGTTSAGDVYLPTQVGTVATWRTLAASFYATFGIRTDGSLWAWGNNGNGQLGDGTITQRTAPVAISAGTTWLSVAAGTTHTVAIRADGSLWAWGNNGNGRLGDGTTTQRTAPVAISAGTTWLSVAAGFAHTVAVRSDGTLWGWGFNSSGQVGNGAPGVDQLVPVQVGTATNWKAVAAGNVHSMAIRTDGTIWTWGSDGGGQLGSGNFTDRSTPGQVGTGTTWQSIGVSSSAGAAIRSDGTLWGWGSNFAGEVGTGTSTYQPTPVQVGTATTWQSLATGCDAGHTVAIRTNGTLWAWGSDNYGQVGAPIHVAVPVLVYAPPLPAITSFTPTFGPLGTTIDLTGTALSGATAITFSGSSGNVVTTGYTVASGTSITGIVVPGGAITGPLTVTTATGTSAASSQSFTVVPPPTLTAAAPTPGGLGQSITLTGTNLSSPTALTINGANALGNIVSNTGTSLVVRVPATAAATGNVSLTTGGGTASLAFAVLAAPGNALAFDGADDHVVLPSGLNTTSFTFEAWVNYQDNGVWTRIFDFGTTTNNWMLLGPKAGVGYTAGSVGNIFFSLKKNVASDETIFTSTPMPTGRWQHLAVTLATAGGTTTGTIYLNGVAIGTNAAMALDPTALGTLTYSWLGRSANGDPYLKASLDEVRIWNTARTAAEVRADMAAPATAPFPAALRFYLNMDQGTPATASTGNNAGLTTLYDLVGAQPATLTNFALASGNTASNFVQSYALVVPTATTSTARSATGFTVNWLAPAYGTATSYLLDVSTTPIFSAPIAGSPFATTATSYTLTGLNPGNAYYYRVRALNSALAQPDQGAFSNVVSQTSPLPVELTAFTATAEGTRAVRLAWATASEQHSAAFEVERSLNGETFAAIGTVAAAGRSSSARSYELTDARLPAGAARLYYRLKQVDTDGSFSYSPVRVVGLKGAAEGLALFPNPATTGATLTGARPGAVVTVFDALGRLVTSATADATGTAALALPAGLPAGVYVVRAGARAVRLTVE